MKPTTDDLATRFLLGELSEEERQAVEQRFLTDNQFFEEVRAAESALVDQYLLGRLTGAERASAKRLFESSPHQRQTLESSKELMNLVRQADHESSANQPDTKIDRANQSRPKEPATNSVRTHESEQLIPNIPQASWTSKRRLIWFATLSVALIVSLVAVVAHFHSQQKAWDATRQTLEQERLSAYEQLRVETQRREQIARQLEIEVQKRLSTEELVATLRPNLRNRTISVFLTPATIERGDNPNIVTFKMGASHIQLQLELDPNWHFSRYGVLITTFEGTKIPSPQSLDSSYIKQGKLELFVPGSSLKPQDYRIALSGWSDSQDSIHLADYVFKVRK